MPSIKAQIDAILQKAISDYHAGRLKHAIESLTLAKQRFPMSAGLCGYLAFFHWEDRNDKLAARFFSDATKLSPHSEKASLGLFHALWRLKRTDEAFDEMRRYLKSYDSAEYRMLLRDMLADPPKRKKKELVHA